MIFEKWGQGKDGPLLAAARSQPDWREMTAKVCHNSSAAIYRRYYNIERGWGAAFGHEQSVNFVMGGEQKKKDALGPKDGRFRKTVWMQTRRRRYFG